MSGRRAARVDGNQGKIVEKLRQLGISVHCTHTVHDGFPDLVAGHRGVNYLFEVKDPAQPESKRKLTEDERAFRDNWRGQVFTIETVQDALSVMGYVIRGDF